MNDSMYLALTGLAIVVLTIAVLISDPTTEPRVERVDQLSGGPYVVERVTAGGPEYLTWVNRGEGLVADWRQEWTSLPMDGWRYADRESAQADARVSKGYARPLREALL